MNSTKTKERPSPGHRRRKQILSIGLCLTVILIGGSIWGSSVTVPGTPASAVDPTQRDAGPPREPATPTPVADTIPSAVAAPTPSNEGDPVAGPTAAAANSQSEAELAATPQLVSAPISIEDSAVLQPGVTATVGDVEAVTGEAAGPGEISGPSIRFKVSVHNQSAQAVSLEDAFVNVEGGADRLPALQLSGPGAARFAASVDAGATASATYVFLLPLDQRNQVHIYLNYHVSSPVAAFIGAVTTSEGKS